MWWEKVTQHCGNTKSTKSKIQRNMKSSEKKKAVPVKIQTTGVLSFWCLSEGSVSLLSELARLSRRRRSQSETNAAGKKHPGITDTTRKPSASRGNWSVTFHMWHQPCRRLIIPRLCVPQTSRAGRGPLVQREECEGLCEWKSTVSGGGLFLWGGDEKPTFCSRSMLGTKICKWSTSICSALNNQIQIGLCLKMTRTNGLIFSNTHPD